VNRLRQQIDEQILDQAAALFARRGFEHTSVQSVADATGYSKAGLLHHYPSKEALREAVLSQAATLARGALEQVRDLPLGPARDLRALEVVVDVALAHPGLVSLLLAPATQGRAPADADPAGRWVLQAFGVDPANTDAERLVRVTGALGALALLCLGAAQDGTGPALRPHILATSYDALGHRRPGVTPSRSDQVEA
jgi:AcrR family transcriptional regulator